jgi:hypothetical protein
VLLPTDTHRKPIASITAVLLPFVAYLLSLPRTTGTPTPIGKFKHLTRDFSFRKVACTKYDVLGFIERADFGRDFESARAKSVPKLVSAVTYGAKLLVLACEAGTSGRQ